ncbi:hypothetical protein B5807_03816 [Epicoccum nigrum]|uniref:Uncharacterized protein n=1 Tax=Epicoccum nigrum TaxID=105696 RepID=A0A1Y2M631_EPING|nr:hypothetical protein B5807_03816 [Epicoccum nigrum]
MEIQPILDLQYATSASLSLTHCCTISTHSIQLGNLASRSPLPVHLHPVRLHVLAQRGEQRLGIDGGLLLVRLQLPRLLLLPPQLQRRLHAQRGVGLLLRKRLRSLGLGAQEAGAHGLVRVLRVVAGGLGVGEDVAAQLLGQRGREGRRDQGVAHAVVALDHVALRIGGVGVAVPGLLATKRGAALLHALAGFHVLDLGGDGEGGGGALLGWLLAGGVAPALEGGDGVAEGAQCLGQPALRGLLVGIRSAVGGLCLGLPGPGDPVGCAGDVSVEDGEAGLGVVLVLLGDLLVAVVDAGKGVDAGGVALHDDVVDNDILVEALAVGSEGCGSVRYDKAHVFNGEGHVHGDSGAACSAGEHGF